VLMSASRNNPILPSRVRVLLYDDICAARALPVVFLVHVVAVGAGLVELAEICSFTVAALPPV